jgi:hypothetical protein
MISIILGPSNCAKFCLDYRFPEEYLLTVLFLDS